MAITPSSHANHRTDRTIAGHPKPTTLHIIVPARARAHALSGVWRTHGRLAQLFAQETSPFATVVNVSSTPRRPLPWKTSQGDYNLAQQRSIPNLLVRCTPLALAASQARDAKNM